MYLMNLFLCNTLMMCHFNEHYKWNMGTPTQSINFRTVGIFCKPFWLSSPNYSHPRGTFCYQIDYIRPHIKVKYAIFLVEKLSFVWTLWKVPTEKRTALQSLNLAVSLIHSKKPKYKALGFCWKSWFDL